MNAPYTGLREPHEVEALAARRRAQTARWADGEDADAWPLPAVIVDVCWRCVERRVLVIRGGVEACEVCHAAAGRGGVSR